EGPLTCGRAKLRAPSGASGRGIQWVGTMGITPADALTQPKLWSYRPTTTEAAVSAAVSKRAHRSNLVPSRGAVSRNCQCMGRARCDRRYVNHLGPPWKLIQIKICPGRVGVSVGLLTPEALCCHDFDKQGR